MISIKNWNPTSKCSPQIIGAISDRTGSLRVGLGATLVSLVVSCIILWIGSRYAPPLDDGRRAEVK